MQRSTASTLAASVAEAIPFDSVPVDFVSDLPLPDVGDVWHDASDFVADSAVVIGKHGGRLVGRTAHVAWRKRSTVATVVVLALAVVGLVALVKRSRTDDDTL
jgi:hypothetical protein